jgi:hypothetical protein
VIRVMNFMKKGTDQHVSDADQVEQECESGALGG